MRASVAVLLWYEVLMMNMKTLAQMPRAMWRRITQPTRVRATGGHVMWLAPAAIATNTRIDESATMSFSGMWCAVNKIADTFRTLPISVYRRLSDDTTERVTSSPVHTLLHRRPNDEMTPGRFKAFLYTGKLLYGNGYAEIERDNGGRPVALWPIHPTRVVVTRDDNGRVVYDIYGDGSVEPVRIQRENMFHILGYSRDGVVGESVMQYARESLGLAIGAERFAAQFLGNNATPSVVVKHPGQLPDEAVENFRRSWRQAYGATGERHGTMVLENGMDVESFGVDPDKAQLLETQQFSIANVSRWTNVPPHMLHALERATFNNIEHLGLEFVVYTLSPHAKDFEEEADLRLVASGEQDVFTKFNMSALLRGDTKTRGEFYREMRRIGIYSANDIRKLEDQNPIGPEGDVYIVEANMVNLEALQHSSETDPPADPPAGGTGDESVSDAPVEQGDDDDLRAIQADASRAVHDAMARILRKEIKAATAAAKRTLSKGDRDGWAAWCAKWYGSYEAESLEIVGPSMRVALRLHGTPTDDVDERIVDTVRRHLTSSKAQLIAVARDASDDPAAAVLERLQEWETSRQLLEKDHADGTHETTAD
jgi:HK97 family phage portal protein